jgi:hypothetical protein
MFRLGRFRLRDDGGALGRLLEGILGFRCLFYLDGRLRLTLPRFQLALLDVRRWTRAGRINL